MSGVRDDAIASLSIKHIDLARRTVFQDARDVRTKNRKTFTSNFFPLVGDEVEAIVADWMACLANELRFGPDEPLFPATLMGLDDNKHFTVVGLDRKHWKDAGAIRRIFKTAFHGVGLSYFNPHGFRKSLVTLGEKCCRNPEEFKAWSQNLGHHHALTTFTSYGEVRSHRQMEIFWTSCGSGSGRGSGWTGSETVPLYNGS